MATKSMAYDHPTYLARTVLAAPAAAAGASTSQKFVAWTNLTVYSVTATLLATGSSTYTGQWNGTATATGALADSFALFRVYNTAAVGATPALATQTWGTYCVTLYNGTSTATQTNNPGFTNFYNIGGTGASGSVTATGGVNINQGDQLFITRGTDATCVTAFAIEVAPTPLASITV